MGARAAESLPRRSSRVTIERSRADVAQLAERVLGKDEVTSSILVIGSSLRPLERATARQAVIGMCRGNDRARLAEAMIEEGA